jgi:hypothetical protein
VGHIPNDPRLNRCSKSLAIHLDDRSSLSQVDVARDWPKERQVYAATTGSIGAGRIGGVAESIGAQPLETFSFEGLQDVRVTRYSLDLPG